MRTELPRRFFHGFVLTGKDLEEIHDILIQRMEGMGTPKKLCNAKYELRFRYGAIQERPSIFDILKEVNGGELTIEGMNITLEDSNNPKDRNIALQFSNVKNLPNPVSIYYNIVGTDEGWVNDTDAQLAIKVRGVKRYSFDRLSRRFLTSGVFIIYLLFFLSFINISAYLGINVFALFGSYRYTFFLTSLFILLVFLIPLILIVLIQVGRFFFPSYNFCWGTYEKSFKRRKAIAIWLIVVVFLGTLLSILANYISVHIGIH